MNLKQYLTERKKMVDAALEEYFAKKCDCPSKLKESMFYSVKAGGKRLRSILAIASAEACGGSKHVMPIAMALEMIHTFSLIHDDLPAMDDDDLRRGTPTNHKVYGEAIAILAGDGLLAEAFSCLASGLSSVKNSVEIINDIANATGARGMTGGQVLDLEAENKKVSYDELRSIHNLKTGALITVSITSGAKVACSEIERIASLTRYGEYIGLAFQIADDILDIEGSEAEIGKPIGSDIENKKSTYPSIIGMDKSKKLAKELVDKAYAALAEFDSKADPLREIARYVVERKN